jgi:predicted RNA binding protein YcfA (HicA-like mRNA interferase family)
MYADCWRCVKVSFEWLAKECQKESLAAVQQMLTVEQQPLYNSLMRRTELEKQLRSLGWARTSFTGILGHAQWKHPAKRSALAVPNEDLILDSVAERILVDAQRGRRY